MKKWLLIIALSSFYSSVMSLEVADFEVKRCNQIDDRLARLACYDALFGREVEVTENSQTGSSSQLPSDVNSAFALAVSNSKTDSGVAMVLYEVNTKNRSSLVKEPIFKNYQSMEGESYEKLRSEADLYFALGSKSGSGARAVIVLSCQSNITNFEIYWERQFDLGRKDVSFKISENGLSNVREKDVVLRTLSSGYRMQLPRGLEGIRIANDVLRGDLLQVVASIDGQNISAFFEISRLQTALPLIAKHCEWR